ncbi:MAG: hypothetical protein WD534_14065 [Phycisphaeraceae bacterium]
MKTLKHALMGIAAMGMMAAPAMAQSNPWSPDQTTVPVTVTVEEMIEMNTGTAAVGLSIVDAGENQGSANAVDRTVNYISNVDIDVFVEIDDDIPDNTQFHVLVNPASSWTVPGDANAEKVISWRREQGSGYISATGNFANQVSSAGVGDTVLAFSDVASAPGQLNDNQMPIQYFADSRNYMPEAGVQPSFNVVWTIAAQD